jgi:hypothetical protein
VHLAAHERSAKPPEEQENHQAYALLRSGAMFVLLSTLLAVTEPPLVEASGPVHLAPHRTSASLSGRNRSHPAFDVGVGLLVGGSVATLAFTVPVGITLIAMAPSWKLVTIPSAILLAGVGAIPVLGPAGLFILALTSARDGLGLAMLLGSSAIAVAQITGIVLMATNAKRPPLVVSVAPTPNGGMAMLTGTF